MVDADGGMLAQAWEGAAQRIANARDDEDAEDGVMRALAEAIVQLSSSSSSSSSSSDAADAAAMRLTQRGGGAERRWCSWGATRGHTRSVSPTSPFGARLSWATVDNKGLVTTPQLHHVVRMANIAADSPPSSAFSSFGIRPSDAKEWASEDGYYGMLASAFHGLVATAPVLPPVAAGPLIVDGACGVGAVKFP